MAEDRIIKSLTLSFPHGATIEQCSFIARKVEGVVGAGVSEGGMSAFGMPFDNDEWKFSEDEMTYVYGHKRRENEEA